MIYKNLNIFFNLNIFKMYRFWYRRYFFGRFTRYFDNFFEINFEQKNLKIVFKCNMQLSGLSLNCVHYSIIQWYTVYGESWRIEISVDFN